MVIGLLIVVVKTAEKKAVALNEIEKTKEALNETEKRESVQGTPVNNVDDIIDRL